MPFTQANAVQNAVLSAETRRRSPIRMLTDMQDRLMLAVMDDETEPREKAQCALAWDKLEARKAVLNGLPANTSQSIRSEPAKKSKPQSTGPIESVQEEAKPSGAQASEASGK
jgi:hypothetical protein